MKDSDYITKATYVSVWDGGIEVKTPCTYNGETKVVSDIEVAEIDGLDMLDDEFIVLPSGTIIRDFINEDDVENY